jgi:hypothetical protein
LDVDPIIFFEVFFDVFGNDSDNFVFLVAFKSELGRSARVLENKCKFDLLSVSNICFNEVMGMYYSLSRDRAVNSSFSGNEFSQ